MSIVSKIQAEYIDRGFGFPVHLLHVPMVQVRGVWTPKINYAELATRVLSALVLKSSPLTGNELKFIRLHFHMTLTQFSQRFYVTHPAVLKWENKGDAITGMHWSTEKDIRLFVHAQLSEPRTLGDVYQQLVQKPSQEMDIPTLDLAQASA